MKVLQILPELNVGGVETGTVDLAHYLKQKGHESLVVSHGGSLVLELQQAGIRHFHLPVHRKNLFTMIQSARKLRKILVTENVDIVHARSRVPAWIAYWACRKTRVAFITTCHGYYGRHPLSQIMGWSKCVIVPSQVIARHMIDHFNVPPESIRLIPRSVDEKKFQIPRAKPLGADPPVITMIGRLTPLKGHTYFFRAMQKVLQERPNVEIWVIGNTPRGKEFYKEELIALTKKLGIERRISFLGNRQDIPQLLAKTDCLVMASVVPESFGRVILEAWAAGVPVVATQIGGAQEIIEDRKTGLLVLPKDPEAMARAVLEILHDSRLAQDLVLQAQQRLKERYTLTHMAEATLNVYRELLATLRILVIKISALGDVILVTASLRAIRKKFPQAQIFCLTGLHGSKVLKRCPYLDRILIYDGGFKHLGWWGFLHLAREIQRYHFDRVIDFQNNWKSHLLGFFSLARERYGYARKGGFLLTHKIQDAQPPMSPIEHQFAVLKALEISFHPPEYLELWPSQKDDQYVLELLAGEWLAETTPFVGIHISASQRWMTKNWPLQHMTRLCDLLAKKNIRVILTGTEQDKNQARQLMKLTRSKPVNLVGKTDIQQLAALVKRCRVYITPDSAPLHVAAAMQTPFIAFFGPTDPLRHLPPAPHYKVMKRDLTCTPCYSPRCRILTHACMEEISPEEVALEVERLMTVKVLHKS